MSEILESGQYLSSKFSLPGKAECTKQRNGLHSISTIQHKFFCSVPPIVDDESGPIDASLWEEGLRNERSFPKNDSRLDVRCDAERGSPRTVLEGPDSSGSLYDEDGGELTGLQSNQKHCIQSLWRSFATKKWQSFPTTNRKKELTISDPVLLTPPGMNREEATPAGPSAQEYVNDLLTVSCSARRSWQTFSYDDISLATNNFDPGESAGLHFHVQMSHELTSLMLRLLV